MEQHMMARYWAAHDREDIEDGGEALQRSGSPLPTMAAEILTDLPSVEYNGPIPDPGNIVLGEMQASMGHIGAKKFNYSIWLRCEYA